MLEQDFIKVLIHIRDELLEEMRETGFYYKRELRYDATTWDINNGLCEDFARDTYYEFLDIIQNNYKEFEEKLTEEL